MQDDGIEQDVMQKILASYPFLSIGSMGGKTYMGVIQNSDAQLLSMYVLELVPTLEQRRLFLELASHWWWESSRQIPINIFLKERFRIFRPSLKHFSRKDFLLEAGPSVSLQEIIARRVRKRQVTLVRKPP